MNLNQLSIIGFIGKNAETKYLANGTPVTKFSVATKKSWKDENDEWKEKTQWHNVTAFGKGFVLLAILHRAFDGPKSIGEWDEFWRQPTLPAAPIRAYLGKWAHRIDLFDDERPFYQDPSLRNYEEKTRTPVNKLFHQKASGNNDTLFDHSLDDGAAGVSFDEAALQLIAAQTFALGGLVTPDPSSPKESKSAEGSPVIKAILFAVVGGTIQYPRVGPGYLLRVRHAQMGFYGDRGNRPEWL